MPRPARLSRSDVVQAALRLAQSEGIDAVTFRRLAAELGAAPMSLYRHVKDRADLIEAMVHAAGPSIAVAAVTESDLPWTDQLRAAAIAIYEVAHGEREIVHAALRHGVVASWEPILFEQVARILERGGATPKAAVSFARYATTVMMSLVLAEIWGRVPADDTWAEQRAAYGAMTEALSDDESVLRAAGIEGFPTSRRALVEEFADFVVAGARATLDSSSGSRRPRRRSASSAATSLGQR